MTIPIPSSYRPLRIQNNAYLKSPKLYLRIFPGNGGLISNQGQDVRVAEGGESSGAQCNEETPCASCSRRGERCRRSMHHSGKTSIPSMSSQPILPTPYSTNATVNLLHIRLFHHFQTCTQQTILFPSEIWEPTFQLCFQFDFLMNTILCIAARHLAVLQPEDVTYPRIAASHMCKALSLFRHQLATSFESTHLDAFIATSILLQYELWASTDDLSSQEDRSGSFDPSKDRIFAVSSSLKQVFLKSIPLLPDPKPSIFLPHLRYNPMDNLVGAAQISNGTLAKYQEFFSYDQPMGSDLLKIPLPCTKGTTDLVTTQSWQHHVPKHPDTLDLMEDVYTPAVTRLCLILSFLPEAGNPKMVTDESKLLPDLARYVLTFPIQCYGPFASMVQQGDPHALLLLYHFYHAVRILLPPSKYWWAHKRATLSEEALKKWLTPG